MITEMVQVFYFIWISDVYRKKSYRVTGVPVYLYQPIEMHVIAYT